MTEKSICADTLAQLLQQLGLRRITITVQPQNTPNTTPDKGAERIIIIKKNDKR